MANNVPIFTQTATDTPANRGSLSPTPTPVRKNYTVLDRVGTDLRGVAMLLNTMTMVVPFLSLPPAASVGPMRAFITDSPVQAIGANQGMLAQGGGVYTCPVYSDGANWYVG